MSAIAYAPDLGIELTKYKSCSRCGINMQVHHFSLRKQCDDCMDFDVFEWGRFGWLFNRKGKA